MIRHGELVYITKPLIEIGMYNPKSGSDDDVIVVNFFVKEENVLSGIQDYIEYIPLKNFISVSTSNYVDEDGFYLVYIEIEKTESLFDDFVFIVKELSNLTSFDEWTIHVYKKQARKIKVSELVKNVKSDSKQI